jgi:hypothetical protein
MRKDSPMPTLAQFKDACRNDFSFLGELGYSELADLVPDNPFSVRFSNGELTLSIEGENWGQHAGVTLFHADGREAPIGWFVPVSEREKRPQFESTGFAQLDDVRVAALMMSRYCRDVLGGDAARFDAVAHEWRRVTDSQYRKSLQKRKLP